MTQITYEQLRQCDFRLHSTDCSDRPHMVLMLSTRSDTALELSPYHDDEREWCCWLRSDMAYSRCRFCYLRTLTTMSQLELLYLAITDKRLCTYTIDLVQFNESLEREREECKRRYHEYCRNERFSYVPG